MARARLQRQLARSIHPPCMRRPRVFWRRDQTNTGKYPCTDHGTGTGLPGPARRVDVCRPNSPALRLVTQEQDPHTLVGTLRAARPAAVTPPGALLEGEAGSRLTGSDGADAGGLLTLVALADLELHALPLVEAAEAASVDF